MSHSASARQYEVGRTYTYEYFTTVILDEPIRHGVSPSKNVGYQLTGYVTVQAVWQNPSKNSERLLQIAVSSTIVSKNFFEPAFPTLHYGYNFLPFLNILLYIFKYPDVLVRPLWGNSAILFLVPEVQYTSGLM
jgi:hypothetical protein